MAIGTTTGYGRRVIEGAHRHTEGSMQLATGESTGQVARLGKLKLSLMALRAMRLRLRTINGQSSLQKYTMHCVHVGAVLDSRRAGKS
jgi:hypothetical protein